MTLDELIDHVCPFKRKLAVRIFKIGFIYGTKWWSKHEKLRHQQDIENIDKDLSKLATYDVDLSKTGEYIDI
jgi:hypothetical protein